MIPRLGRWCHPSSEVYRATCDQNIKAVWNLYDHSFTPLPKPSVPPPGKQEERTSDIERDLLTVFLVAW